MVAGQIQTSKILEHVGTSEWRQIAISDVVHAETQLSDVLKEVSLHQSIDIVLVESGSDHLEGLYIGVQSKSGDLVDEGFLLLIDEQHAQIDDYGSQVPVVVQNLLKEDVLVLLEELETDLSDVQSHGSLEELGSLDVDVMKVDHSRSEGLLACLHRYLVHCPEFEYLMITQERKYIGCSPEAQALEHDNVSVPTTTLLTLL